MHRTILTRVQDAANDKSRKILGEDTSQAMLADLPIKAHDKTTTKRTIYYHATTLTKTLNETIKCYCKHYSLDNMVLLWTQKVLTSVSIG